MRVFATWIVSGLFLAVMLSGCGGSTATSLLYDGVGSSLHQSDTLDRATQAEQYFGLMCRRAGIKSSGHQNGTDYCNYSTMNKKEWQKVIYASLNDIDERCEAYIDSIDAARKDKAVLDKQLALTSQTTSALIGFATSATGSVSLSIVQAAFGLVEKSVDNYYSRMLLKLENTTVYTVVRRQQSTYRESLNYGPKGRKGGEVGYIRHVDSKPTAYFAIRGYLRLCLPSTIESEINAVIVDVHYKPGSDKRQILSGTNPDLAMLNSMPATPKSATDIVDRWNNRPGRSGGNGETPGQGEPEPSRVILHPAAGFEERLALEDGEEIQRRLCVEPSGDFGLINARPLSKTRKAIRMFEQAMAGMNQARVWTKDGKLSRTDAAIIQGTLSKADANRILLPAFRNLDNFKKPCKEVATQPKNAFERYRFGTSEQVRQFQSQIVAVFKKSKKDPQLAGLVPENFVSGVLDAQTRNAIQKIHAAAIANNVKLSPVIKSSPSDEITYELLRAWSEIKFFM